MSPRARLTSGRQGVSTPTRPYGRSPRYAERGFRRGHRHKRRVYEAVPEVRGAPQDEVGNEGGAGIRPSGDWPICAATAGRAPTTTSI
jgi:hypothetical protein